MTFLQKGPSRKRKYNPQSRETRGDGPIRKLGNNTDKIAKLPSQPPSLLLPTLSHVRATATRPPPTLAPAATGLPAQIAGTERCAVAASPSSPGSACQNVTSAAESPPPCRCFRRRVRALPPMLRRPRTGGGRAGDGV